MRKLVDILPENDQKRKYLAIGISIVISGLLTLWGIYGIGEYGVALFILTPLTLGVCSTVLYGLKKGITQKTARRIALSTLAIFILLLLLTATEGVICVIMAAPFGLFFTWLGSVIGFGLVNKIPEQGPLIILVCIGSIPTLAFVEKNSTPPVHCVVTSVEIQATPAVIWEQVIAFPQLAEPTELLFKTGIAYPINATIEGSGVGAVRHCNFTTGSFIEPITVWNEPYILQFDVVEQPAPMKELSFWDIHAPHLHDYFVSKQGRFTLTPLPNGNTLLEGRTWYYHNIKPAFYWQLWSDHIIHKIHQRVLWHIKTNAEKTTTDK